MTNSNNPNQGHWNPAPVITHPKSSAPDSRTAGQDSKSATRKGGA